MSEVALQEKILAALKSNADRWRNIPITKSTSEARTMFDLLGDSEHGRDFDLQTEEVLVKVVTPREEAVRIFTVPRLPNYSRCSLVGGSRCVTSITRKARFCVPGWPRLTHACPHLAH